MDGTPSCEGNDKSLPANETLGTQQKASVNDTTSIPDGGIKAWMQVMGTFFIFFNTWQVGEE